MTSRLKYPILLSLHLMVFVGSAQIQLGPDLVGDSLGYEYGSDVSISASGKIVAISDARYNGEIPFSGIGQVRLYEWKNQSWEQMGKSLNGKEARDGFGYAVALSDDGSRLVACAHNSQSVTVFDYDGSNWIQVGESFPGGTGSLNTHDVAISADGNIVAVGAANFPKSIEHRGVVRAYQLQSSQWKQLGDDIIGEDENDQSGWSIDLSADGKTLAIGSINNNSGGYRGGHARVFKLIDGDWKQWGNEINAKGAGYSFGGTVSLSSDGNRIAIGGWKAYLSEDQTGYAGIYEYNSGKWNIVGSEISGYKNESFGWKVNLSGDGQRVAISSPDNHDCPVRIYEMNSGSWQQIGRAIKTNPEIPSIGYATALSSDGKRITASSLYGHFARVFDISDIIFEDASGDNCGSNSEQEEEVSIKIFPNPTFENITITGVDMIKLIEENSIMLFDALGRKMERFEIEENTIDLSFLPPGLYYIRIENKIEKVVKVSL